MSRTTLHHTSRHAHGPGNFRNVTDTTALAPMHGLVADPLNCAQNLGAGAWQARHTVAVSFYCANAESFRVGAVVTC